MNVIMRKKTVPPYFRAQSPCHYCCRQNEADAQFCNDCGKPLTKGAAARVAVAAGSRSGGVSRTSGPPAPGMGAATAEAPCPVCGTGITAHSGPERRLIPDRRAEHSHTLGLLPRTATELPRFERGHAAAASRRTRGRL